MLAPYSGGREGADQINFWYSRMKSVAQEPEHEMLEVEPDVLRPNEVCDGLGVFDGGVVTQQRQEEPELVAAEQGLVTGSNPSCYRLFARCHLFGESRGQQVLEVALVCE